MRVGTGMPNGEIMRFYVNRNQPSTAICTRDTCTQASGCVLGFSVAGEAMSSPAKVMPTYPATRNREEPGGSRPHSLARSHLRTPFGARNLVLRENSPADERGGYMATKHAHDGRWDIASLHEGRVNETIRGWAGPM